MHIKKIFRHNSRLFLIMIASFTFLTESNAQAVAGIGSYSSGSKIPKSVFSTLPTIGVYVRDVVFEAKYVVVSYTVKLADNEGSVKQVICQGSQFSSLAKQYINDYTKPGAVISIENIKAKDEGGREIKLPALIYYIE